MSGVNYAFVRVCNVFVELPLEAAQQSKLLIVSGRIPMRQLVYRVQALPQSMLPLVWDFGQLATATEELYIKQMVNRYVSTWLLRLKVECFSAVIVQR